MQRQVVVVGAGLGGLVCAKNLQQSGFAVQLLEKSDRPGGRLKTNQVNGFLIDQGFQTVFTAYPHLRQEVDLRELDLRFFEPGCFVVWNERLRAIYSDRKMKMAFSTFLEFTDKFRALGYSGMLKSIPARKIWADKETTIEDDLKLNGFTESFTNRFIKPFFGSVFLNRDLAQSQLPFRYIWKMIVSGQVASPSEGIEELPKAIASKLEPGSILCNVEVETILEGEKQVRGVRLSTGEEIGADAIVLATDFLATRKLSNVSTPTQAVGCISFAFSAPDVPYSERMVTVNGNHSRPVSHVAFMTNLSPKLAPKGRHLILVTCLNQPDSTEAEIEDRVRSQLARWYPSSRVKDWELLRRDDIPVSQFAQPVGFRETLAPLETKITGLFCAGEQTTYSSIDGACLGGRLAAEKVKSFLESK